MPVTIKKSVLKYKNQNGQYVNVDMAAERPLAEQIAEIEAAGEEVLESIPSEYTELEGRVDDLETSNFIRATDQYGDPIIIPEINDTITSLSDVWSSSKVAQELERIPTKVSDMQNDSNFITGIPEIINISDVISTNHTLNANYSHIEKIGKIIFLTVSIVLTSDVAAYGTIASIAEGYRPMAQIWGRCFGIDFDVTASGNIRPLGGTIASGKSLQATIIYCTI